jgi:hypothetical protein
MSLENSKSEHVNFNDRIEKQEELETFVSENRGKNPEAVNAVLEKVFSVGQELCDAVKQENKDVLTTLLNTWRNDNYFILMINYKEKPVGITPLIYACSGGRVDFVKMFINTPGVDINCGDYSFRTPLFHAAWQGKKEIVELLLARSDINIDSHTMRDTRCDDPKYKRQCQALDVGEGITPLGIASQKAVSITKSDPEHIKIKNGYLEIVELIRNAKSKKQENGDRFYLGTLSNVARGVASGVSGAAAGVASGVSSAAAGVATGVASGFSKAASYFPGWGNGGKSKRIHRKRKNKTKKGRSRKHKK